MANMIPEDVVDNVRNSVDIVDVVSRYVALKKAGKNLFGVCPFHDEKTPSFSVSEDKQIFHCFSCGRGGNVFKFLMDLEKVSFPEAVLKVANFANITLDQKYIRQNKQSQYTSKQSELINLYEEAAKLYTHILLNTQLGQSAMKYLTKRGLTEDDIKEFNLGFAPSEDDILISFFKEHDFDDELLNNSGLFTLDSNQKLHDRFFDRIMFPIKDRNGKIVAFSGRSLVKDDRHPKYLNSPETSIFNKGKILYNVANARSEIISKKTVILFEGFMDVIAASHAGVKNAIATMGTSLTSDHLRLLDKMADTVVLCFDGDEPGQKAIERSIRLINDGSNLKIKVIFIPDNQDPDEYVQDNGPTAFKELMSQSGETSTSFLLKFDRRHLNLSNESDQLEYIKMAIARLSKLKDSVEQDLYLNQLSEEFKIDKQDLKFKLRQEVADKIAHQPRFQPAPAPVEAPHSNPKVVVENRPARKTKIEIAQYQLIARALNNHDVWLKLKSLPDFYFLDESLQTIYMLLDGYFDKKTEYDTADFMDYLKDPNLQSVIAEIETLDLSPDFETQELEDYLKVIKKFAPLEKQIIQVKNDLNEAKRLGNQGLQQELTLKLITLYQQRQQL